MAKSISNLFSLYCDGVSSPSLSLFLFLCPQPMPMFVNLPSKHSSIPFPTHPFSPLPLIPAHTTMHIPISCHWASIASLDCVKCLSCLFAYVKCFIRLSYVHTHTHIHVYRIPTYTYILATLALAQVPPLTRLPRLSQQSCQCVPHSSAVKISTQNATQFIKYIPFIIVVCSMFFVLFPRLMFIAFYDVNRIIFWHTLA